MTKIKNVPDAVPLDDEGVFYLSIVYAWRDIFPPALREFARLKSFHLNHHIGGVQARHYNKHKYMEEKRAALEALHRLLEGEHHRLRRPSRVKA